MTIGFDDAVATVLVGTTEQTINNGNPLTTPNDAQQIIEVSPYICVQGAFDSDEALAPIFRIQSDDVSVEPKRFNLPVIQGGDALYSFLASPIMPSWAMNIKLNQQSRINYFANNQNDAAIEPLIGATVVYSDQQSNLPEQFWQKPDNESATGTVINTRSAGNDITITGGAEINWLISIVGLHTAVVSAEHLNGVAEFVSSDFQTAFPYKLQVTAVNTGIGETGNLPDMNAGAGIKRHNMPIGQGIPIAGRTVINNFFTQRDGLGAAGFFLNSVGYIK